MAKRFSVLAGGIVDEPDAPETTDAEDALEIEHQAHMTTKEKLAAEEAKCEQLETQVADLTTRLALADSRITDILRLAAQDNAARIACEAKETACQQKCSEMAQQLAIAENARFAAESMLDAERHARLESEKRTTILTAELKRPVQPDLPLQQPSPIKGWKMNVTGKFDDGGIRTVQLTREE